MAALKELPPLDFTVHSDTGWERAATYEFSRKWASWLERLGVRVITTRSPDSYGMIDRWGGVQIPAFTVDDQGKKGQIRRQCTGLWKIKPLRRILRSEMTERGLTPRPDTVELWLGITMDEFQRARTSGVKYVKNTFPLLDLKMTRDDCVQWLTDHGLPVPGKSSCVFCPYHDTATWKELHSHEEDYKTALQVDEEVRAARPPGLLYVHPSRRPLAKAVEDGTTEDGCPGSYCFM
jgi:hypothetical protein